MRSGMIKRFVFLSLGVVALCIFFIGTASAQTAARKRTARAAPARPGAVATPLPSPEPEKANSRPSESVQDRNNNKVNKRTSKVDPKPADNGFQPTHIYQFDQPNFTTSKIVIEHDDSGKGSISFTKKGFDETVTDPIQLSAATLERLNNALNALDFLNSTEDYQYEKDYSHLGNASITVRKDGRERTARYNWTQNKDAKALADEYRKLGNQYIWMFDITVARENQPLESPRLIDSFDSMLRRKDIADPEQMVPFLQGLANDERIPLIARNHAGKLVKQIEKSKK